MKKLAMIWAISVIMFTSAWIQVDAEDSETEISTEYIESELKIDTDNKYDSMQQSYSEGYEPEILGKYAKLILPLYMEGNHKPKTISAGIQLGDIASTPFVLKNYEKTIPCEAWTSANGEMKDLYLVNFLLEMKEDRVNGTYPIDLHVKADKIEKDYRIYITVTNGTESNSIATDTTETETEMETEMEDETPYQWEEITNAYIEEKQTEAPIILPPKVIIESVSGNKVKAGEIAELHIFAKNTSEQENIKNLIATVSTSSDKLLLIDASDTIYMNEIKKNSTKEIIYKFQTLTNAPSGNENITLNFEYYYASGCSASSSSVISVSIATDTVVEFTPIEIPDTVVVSDSLNLTIQALNLGKNTVNNVRACIDGDGLYADTTAFIGELLPESSAETQLLVHISSKSGKDLYGKTEGTITFYYTDSDGIEHNFIQNFTTTIKSPFEETISSETEQVSPNYWVYIMAVIGTAIVISGVYLMIRFRKREQ